MPGPATQDNRQSTAESTDEKILITGSWKLGLG